MPDYTELFEQRGSSYDRAMQSQPRARAAEFKQVLAPIEPRPGLTIADVPAGGGYLKPYIPDGCIWTRHEPCADFITHAGQGEGKEGGTPLYPFPWADDSVDAVVSLAGLHHLSDKRPFYAEAARVARSDSSFILSDAAKGHAVTRFLDDFVGAHNTTGHEGIYLDDAVPVELGAEGWKVLEDDLQEYHWQFADREKMAQFAKQLFDIQHASLWMIEEAIAEWLGIDELADGTVGMRWALRRIHCKYDG